MLQIFKKVFFNILNFKGTKDHLLKIVPKTVSDVSSKEEANADELKDHLFNEVLTSTSSSKSSVTTEPRDHLLNIIKTAIKKDDEENSYNIDNNDINAADNDKKQLDKSNEQELKNEARDHLLNVIQINSKETSMESEPSIELTVARDHLLNPISPVQSTVDVNKFVGNIFGLVYNQFR